MVRNNTKQSLRILIVGSLDSPEDSTTAGGTTILLWCLINELQRRHDVEVNILDIGCSRQKTGFLKDIGRVISFLFRAPSRIRKVDVVTVHLCSPSSLGLPILILARCFHKPLIIRKFGGNDYRESKAYCWPWLAEIVLRKADLYLAETHKLVHQALQRGIGHTKWFPTHRSMTLADKPNHKNTKCHRFVYIGQVREYKGIIELVKAAELLNDGETVDVYGPIFDDLPPDLFKGRKRIFYKGFLQHKDVVSTMRNYDAFILPTKATTEGYPGVILEAYAAYLPVVATTCGAIPEIVDETSGILIEPRNVDALYRAMKRLNEDSQLYVRLCKGVQERAECFSAVYWTEEFFKYCLEVIESYNKIQNLKRSVIHG